MITQIDNKASKQWEKSAFSFKNYQDLINNKSERFKLSLVDLLYISNFKGGNSTINEDETTINKKLEDYTKVLIKIDKKFNGKSLQELAISEIEELINLITLICNLTHKETSTKIDGFSVSYLSALLSSYFPTLIPILDRRVLINLNLVDSNNNSEVDKYGQIKNIQRFYPPLVKKFAELCEEKKMSVRDIDKTVFTIKIVKTQE